MENTIIKKLVREGLTKFVTENIKKSYPDVFNALNKDEHPTAPSLVGIAQKALNYDPDNSTDRSLFRKKLHQEKNDEGSYYQFDDDELAKIRAALSAK